MLAHLGADDVDRRNAVGADGIPERGGIELGVYFGGVTRCILGAAGGQEAEGETAASRGDEKAAPRESGRGGGIGGACEA